MCRGGGDVQDGYVMRKNDKEFQKDSAENKGLTIRGLRQECNKHILKKCR